MDPKEITAMAAIMIAARRANEDVGSLIAGALAASAEKLGGIDALVRGRPGSWEADIILRMAHQGGAGNEERLDTLTSLFVAMGEKRVDGGDVLSQAMSEAVDALGGLDQFAGASLWYWDLTNMGRQYSQYWDA